MGHLWLSEYFSMQAYLVGQLGQANCCAPQLISAFFGGFNSGSSGGRNPTFTSCPFFTNEALIHCSFSVFRFLDKRQQLFLALWLYHSQLHFMTQISQLTPKSICFIRQHLRPFVVLPNDQWTGKHNQNISNRSKMY